MTSQDLQLNGLRVSRETTDRLNHFAALFQKWARTINLVAPSTLSDLWSRHIRDSAQIFALSPKPQTWIDLGSGGGFPGIITAILMSETGDGWVHLVESNQKKAAFLRVALQETAARGTVHVARVEEMATRVSHCDAISARALASLDHLLALTEPWMTAQETTAYFHKGRDYSAEVAKARGRFDFHLVKHKSVVEADSVILEISQVTRQRQGAGANHVTG